MSIEPTARNIRWCIIEIVEHAHKATKDVTKAPTPSVSKLSKNTTVPKRNGHFLIIHTGQVTGPRNASLEYLLRKHVAVVMPHPPLETAIPYTSTGGSIQADQKNHLSHTHTLYRLDNKQLYEIIEETVRGSVCEATIKPFQRTKDGVGAYHALIRQHAGKDKWLVVLKESKDYIHHCKWDGTTPCTVQSHIERTRHAHVQWEDANHHVPDAVPEARSRTQNLIDSIANCKNHHVCARVVHVSSDDLGMLIDFDKAQSSCTSPLVVPRR